MSVKVIKYGASWCSPCKAASKLLQERKDITLEEIDIEENEAATEGKNIRSIPYIEFYKEDSNEPFATHVGMLTLLDLNSILSEVE